MNSVSITHESYGIGLEQPTEERNANQGFSPGAVEIIILWNDTVQDVVHHKIDGEASLDFKVGESPECDFLIPAELLGSNAPLSLVKSEGETLQVSAPKEASFEISMADGDHVPLNAPGVHSLKTNGRADIGLGPWKFVVRTLGGLEKFSAPAELDWQSGYFIGISAVLHAAFFLIIGLVPPNASGLNLDPNSNATRFQKYILSAAETRLQEPPKMEEKVADNTEEQGGLRHKGTEGKAGDRRVKRKTGNRFGIKGPRDNMKPVMGRLPTKEMVRNAGILAYIDTANAPTSPFGSLTPLGRDPENALGGLTGDTFGADIGFGGLGMQGTGRGGGGLGEGSIGVGSLGFIGVGHGKGGPGHKWGRPKGDLKKRKPSGPIIVSKPASVKGSISKEVIRRIVKRHLNEVRFCYEKGLRKRSDIEGRVAVQFLISGSGAVQRSTVASSTVEDPAVGSCIARVIERIAFPVPGDGGIVVVTYPFMLSSQGGI